MGPGDDPTDSGIPVSHLIMNGMPSASVPIPFQRIETNNQQQQQQQQQQQHQQMLLYQQQQAYQYQMLQQQAAHYEMNAPSNNFQQYDYTLIQPQSYESQSIMNAFNPQTNGTNQQDPQLANLAQTPVMSWLSTTMAAQQQTANQQSPYGSSSNQYIINGNQDNYLQQLQNFHQSPATLPSLLGQPQYWSALPTAALLFPAPPPQAMLAQQQTSNNEQQSPQSKTNNNNRPLTPTNSTDILSTSQPNQQAQQYMNMPRTTQTPGMNKENFLIEKNSIDLILVNFPYFAAASPTFLDPNLMMSSTRQPSGSPALRMYPQQVPIPSMSSHIPFLLISISFF
jgi:nuclear factor of activated T-cells 5